MINSVIFKAYIGPRPVMPNDAENYGKWDWFSAIGDDYDPLPYLGRGTLAGNLGSSSTGPIVRFGPSIPVTGGLWVGPNGSTETWEYIAYHSSADASSTLKRQSQPPNSSLHTVGAPWYFWYPLDTNNGQFEYVQEVSDNLSARTWTAKLSGVQAPAMILKPEHMIAITYFATWFPGDVPIPDPEDFPLFCLGFIEKVSMKQNGKGEGTWSIDIVSTARLLQGTSIPGVRMGPLNIALEAEASASSSLGAAWKLTLPQREDASLPEIDIITPQEDFSASNAVDENEDTLWVSDGWRGPNMTNSHGHSAWSSIFVYPPAMDQFGVRYLELTNVDGIDMHWWWVYTKYSYIDPVDSLTKTRSRWIQATETDMLSQNGLDDTDAISGNDESLVIAENGATFRRVFPAANPKHFIDASTLDGPKDPEAVRRIWWEGGAIFLAWSSPANSAGHLVSWGDVDYEELENHWEGEVSLGIPQSGTSDFDLPEGSEHLDHVPLSELRAGAVIRRNFSTSGVDYVSDFIHRPGYIIRTEDEDEWIKFVLPPMTHLLREDVEIGATEIFLVDGQNNPNVEGLSRHGFGGMLYIDDELVPFTGKDYYQGKLTGCTVGRKHKGGTKVYVRQFVKQAGKANTHALGPGGVWVEPFKDKLFEVASDGYPLSKIEWGRGKYGTGADRYPHFGDYDIRFSISGDTRPAGEDGFENDYLSDPIAKSTVWGGMDAPNTSIDMTTGTFGTEGLRARSFLFQIRTMHDASHVSITARPRLNYFRAFVDMRYFNPDTWLDTTSGSGWANDLLVDTLLGLSNWWPSLFITWGNPELPPQMARQRGVTDTDTTWRIASDAAEYGSSVIDVRRNSRVRSTTNGYLVVPEHTPSRIYTTEDFIEVEIVNVRPAEVGQVRVTWLNGDSTLNGVALYPDELPRGTSLVEIGPLIVNSQTIADRIAFNSYTTKRFPYNVFATMARSDEDIEVGEIHQVDYDFHLTGEIIRKILMVESVTQTFEAGRWHTVVGYREISRETV